MHKSKKNLDLSISREITTRVRLTLRDILNDTLSSSRYEDGSWKFPYQYLLDSFESKYVDEDTDAPEVKRQRAIVKWLGVERRNERTNHRLYNTDPVFWKGTTGWRVLTKASRLVRKVLGDTPPEDLLSFGGFTGGATTSRKRGVEALSSKFIGQLDATPECFNLVKNEIEDAQVWTLYQPEVLQPRLVKGNVMFTVPKSAIIDRVCCKEPDLNIYFQKSVGNFIRNRMRRHTRCNLNDQSINRELARVGSINRSLATIDLSSASDSLSDALVQILLPREWYVTLDALRCRKTFIDGKSHVNEMFSSMGNGFTFELESLVFWALARATLLLSDVKGVVSVYGDDIIVPTCVSARVINILRWTGFTPNVKKTFRKGPFRESCGGHYYSGHDVTPFYLRRPFKDVSDLILFLNQFRAWIIRVGADELDGGWVRPNNYVKLWYDLAAFVPKALRGGWDVTSRTQLASRDRPMCELRIVTRHLAGLSLRYSLGTYLSRLCEYDKRQPEMVPDSSDTVPFVVPTTKWKVRPVKVRARDFGLETPLFITEQLNFLESFA